MDKNIELKENELNEEEIENVSGGKAIRRKYGTRGPIVCPKCGPDKIPDDDENADRI